MTCQIAVVLEDPLVYWRNRPRYIGPSLGELISKEILGNNLYVEEPNFNRDWHRHVEEHGPRPQAYVLYNLAMVEFEESLCSK